MNSERKIELSIFEENLVLPPIAFKIILFAFSSLSFTFGAIFIFQDEKLTGALVAFFFGLSILTNIIPLVPGSIQLTLTKEVSISPSTFQAQLTKWSNFKWFKIGYIVKCEFVKFDFASRYEKYKSDNGIAKFISGNHGALPYNYWMSSE